MPAAQWELPARTNWAEQRRGISAGDHTLPWHYLTRRERGGREVVGIYTEKKKKHILWALLVKWWEPQNTQNCAKKNVTCRATKLWSCKLIILQVQQSLWAQLPLGGTYCIREGGTKEVRHKNHVTGCLEFAKTAKIFSQKCKTICVAWM